MEEYKCEIEYVKGKENKVADCPFRLFPITKDTLQEAMEFLSNSNSRSSDRTVYLHLWIP